MPPGRQTALRTVSLFGMFRCLTRRSLLGGLLAVALGLACGPTTATMPLEDAALWEALSRPGAILLLRHATAPGVGDPEGFRLDDCATQRNLSDAGREEALRWGLRLRERAIPVAAVWSSQWCRTRETARLLAGNALPAPRDEPAFNSFFQQGDVRSRAQTEAARRLLVRWRGPGALVVVTHQVNITALTGQFAASAQGVVVVHGKDGTLQVVGALSP